jgi:hypothetical protein
MEKFAKGGADALMCLRRTRTLITQTLEQSSSIHVQCTLRIEKDAMKRKGKSIIASLLSVCVVIIF